VTNKIEQLTHTILNRNKSYLKKEKEPPEKSSSFAKFLLLQAYKVPVSGCEKKRFSGTSKIGALIELPIVEPAEETAFAFFAYVSKMYLPPAHTE